MPPARPAVVATTPAPAPAPPQPPAPEDPLDVAWGEVDRNPGCFYFSGPQNVGRDTHLGTSAVWMVRGTSARLRIHGASPFSGTLVDGQFLLRRTQGYEFHGAWTVTETIAGTVSDGALSATYHYEECEAGASCPGSCGLTAPITLTPPGKPTSK